MEHLGDITKINSREIPPVDVVIGGSPCQDLSIAGKRAGLDGARSGLFMEQIRIVREVRDAEKQHGRAGQFIRPRFMLWENVPGALSSNKGEDFRIVLEETARIAEPDASIPGLPGGRWRKSGCILGTGWSIAWRILDAQFWGVPQRRRRIALVADFGGHAAPEILFVRQSVCGYPAQSGTAGEEASTRAGIGAYPAIARSLTARYDGSPCIDRGPNIVWCIQGNVVDRDAGMNGSGVSAGPMYTLNTVDCHAVCAGFKPHAGASAGSIGYSEELTPTIDTGKPMAVYDARGNGDGKIACTLTGDHQSRVTDYTAIVMATGQGGAETLQDLCPALNCNHEQPVVAHALRARANDPHREDAATYPITTGGKARRLTPMECERLQGYPDGWTDIGPWTDRTGKLHKKSSDAARYKALGNSIALPPWKWVLKRLCACYERDATMGSLFDGIGGFPLLWERLNGPGTCLWASEVDEFCIAVTKKRIGG